MASIQSGTGEITLSLEEGKVILSREAGRITVVVDEELDIHKGKAETENCEMFIKLYEE